jgi:hypothetical protein
MFVEFTTKSKKFFISKAQGPFNIAFSFELSQQVLGILQALCNCSSLQI